MIAWTERCGRARTKFGEPWIFSPDLVALKVWAGLQQQPVQWRSVWSSHKLLRCEVRLRHLKTAIRTPMMPLSPPILLSPLLPGSTNVPTAICLINNLGKLSRVAATGTRIFTWSCQPQRLLLLHQPCSVFAIHSHLKFALLPSLDWSSLPF